MSFCSKLRLMTRSFGIVKRDGSNEFWINVLYKGFIMERGIL